MFLFPQNDQGKVDDFIDDGITIVADLHENSIRAINFMLLSIYYQLHPKDKNVLNKCYDCLSLGKLEEEGMLSKKINILG
jgi:hypothetical protein